MFCYLLITDVQGFVTSYFKLPDSSNIAHIPLSQLTQPASPGKYLKSAGSWLGLFKKIKKTRKYVHFLLVSIAGGKKGVLSTIV